MWSFFSVEFGVWSVECGVSVGKIEFIYYIRLFPTLFIFVCHNFTVGAHPRVRPRKQWLYR